jgi:hypothetical protein
MLAVYSMVSKCLHFLVPVRTHQRSLSAVGDCFILLIVENPTKSA